MGQRIIPNTQSNRIETILAQEGLSYHNSGVWNGSISASNQSNVIGVTGNFSTAHVIVNTKVVLSSTKDVALYTTFDSESTGVISAKFGEILVPAGSAVAIDFPTPMSPLSFGVSLYADASQVGVAVKIGSVLSGIKMINDLNFNAKRKVYWMGDSITDFTANAIGMTNYYQFQVRDWLTKNSSIGDYRLTQKAWGGKTSNDFDKLLIQGSLYVESPDIIFYQLGMNDASQSISTSVYTANMQRIINYKQTYWKDAILVFLGTTPAQLTSRENGIVPYRNAMSNLVTATGDAKVKYISLANPFDRTATNTTIWAASDIASTSTDALHPGTILSHTGIANTITSAIQSWGITF